ncbi:MAG: hypothetical protein K0U47_05740 [Epsilonproteobacteria bacterium]|nr:hypothetical protein [Campylobacterota bacterium]
MTFNRATVLVIILSIIGIIILFTSIRIPIGDTITISLIQQKGKISTIDTPIKPEFTTNLSVSSLNFPSENKMLHHKDIGRLGHKKEFFIKATTLMDVKEKGVYLFDVLSDDGFRLTVNDQVFCEYKYTRPMRTTTCTIPLEKKEYRFELLYFQKSGPMGLKVYYKKQNDTKTYFVGDSSAMITFQEPKQ